MNFSPGDFVEIVNVEGMIQVCPETLGKVGEIIKYIGDFRTGKFKTVDCYMVKIDIPGSPFAVTRRALRLIPPEDECRFQGSWDVIPWNPYKQKVT